MRGEKNRPVRTGVLETGPNSGAREIPGAVAVMGVGPNVAYDVAPDLRKGWG